MKRTLLLTLLCCILLFSLGCAASEQSSAEPSAPLPSSPMPVPTQAPPSEAPVPTATPKPTPTPDPLQQKIDSMSDSELIGQMVMIGFSGSERPPEVTQRLMREYKVGGVILFGWIVSTFAQTEKLVKNIKSYNACGDIPLLIGIDVEGGQVHRLPWKPYLLSAQKLGQKNSTQAVYDQYKRIGQKLSEIGINLDFAPVLDIAKNTNGTFLGSRMFGSDAGKVSKLVPYAVKGLHDGGVLSMGKHFPGHGETATDSHVSLPVINVDSKTLREYTLKPFQAAVDNGIDAMLVAHLSLPKVDKNITSLSPEIITSLLREEMGFSGVVFSDDIRMRSITKSFSVGEAAVRHIEAGGDIVLIGKYYDKQEEVLQSLNAAVKAGRLTRKRLEESVYRILQMKANAQKYAQK